MGKGNEPAGGWMTFTSSEEWKKAIMERMAKRQHDEDEEQSPRKVTDIDAAKSNIEEAVFAFNERWAPMPGFALDVEAMDQRRLRDAMGLRATIDTGDPWPKAEQLLLEMGFKWHWLGGMRVMFVQERDSFVQAEDDWSDGEEVEDSPAGHCGLDAREEL